MSQSNRGVAQANNYTARKYMRAEHSGLSNNCGFFIKSIKDGFNVLYTMQQMQDASGKTPLVKADWRQFDDLQGATDPTRGIVHTCQLVIKSQTGLGKS